ncbi:MAG: hypothetical protein ACPLUI_13315, partial [Desulfofundulus sp.]
MEEVMNGQAIFYSFLSKNRNRLPLYICGNISSKYQREVVMMVMVRHIKIHGKVLGESMAGKCVRFGGEARYTGVGMLGRGPDGVGPWRLDMGVR